MTVCSLVKSIKNMFKSLVEILREGSRYTTLLKSLSVILVNGQQELRSDDLLWNCLLFSDEVSCKRPLRTR